jgi:type IV pilus assembly protein PilY1
MYSLLNAAVSTNDLSSEEGFVYRAGFYRSTWSGSLKKYVLKVDPDGTPIINPVKEWDAADKLIDSEMLSLGSLSKSRNIYTARIDSETSLTTIEFKWSNLANSQRSTLNISPVNGKRDGLGEKRVDYLRGARELEQGRPGGFFRMRGRLLGDIIGSNSTYVGAPGLTDQGAAYNRFRENSKGRPSVLYVGANDGMLHAFDADTGGELFAYIPSFLIPGLIHLTNPKYSHRPYVDGSSSASDVMVRGTWKTVLASGLGGGAQGVFALDVTDPSNFGHGTGVLWEFTDADDSDLGNQMSAPLIAKFNVGTSKGRPEYRYFVVVSSGLNNYKDDGKGKFHASAAGALFLLSLDKAPSEKWKRNVNYFKFSSPIKDAAIQNGLSAPALVTGDNGAVRYAYAGDLQGNLWRYDFTGNLPWPHARSSDTPIFTATDPSGAPQPITMQPRVVFAPDGGYVILFGTGKLLEQTDAIPANFKVQSFYGIYDTTNSQYFVKSRNQLEVRALSHDYDGDLKIAGNEFKFGTAVDTKRGWYIDFPDSEHTGERSISNPVIASGKVFFNTFLANADECGKGSWRSYALDALTALSAHGESVGHVSSVSVSGMPVILQTRAGQKETAVAKTSSIKKKKVVVNIGSSGAIEAIPGSNSEGNHSNNSIASSRHFGWREIQNWQELHNAAINK